MSQRLEIVRSQTSDQRRFCRGCGCLLLGVEPKAHIDKGHNVQEGVSDTEMAEPSRLLSPVDDRKAQAVGVPSLVPRPHPLMCCLGV